MTPAKPQSNQLFEALSALISNNPNGEELTSVLKILETLGSQNQPDNNYNGSVEQNIEFPEGDEPQRYNNRRGSKPRETERLHQMAKNREYARKCVQKKKDQRKEAEIRCKQISEKMEVMKNERILKARNAEFAVFLASRANPEDLEILGVQEKYENDVRTAKEYWKKVEAEDDTVNVNFARLATATEEFNKASHDLREKNGVIGTLGSRKIRAKQHMEWRSHLYNLSIYEHHLKREQQLFQLADDFVKATVSKVTKMLPLDGKTCSISKELLNELIETNRGSQLAEFVQFVQQTSLVK